MYLSIKDGAASMRYSEQPIDQDVEVTLTTTYSALMAVTDGEMTLDAFQTEHSEIDVAEPQAAKDFAGLMQAVFALLSR